MMESGKTIEEIVEAKPTEEFDERIQEAFLTPEGFVRIDYSSLRRDPAYYSDRLLALKDDLLLFFR